MKGWRYEWVAELPLEVYEVLIAEMHAAQAEIEEP